MKKLIKSCLIVFLLVSLFIPTTVFGESSFNEEKNIVEPRIVQVFKVTEHGLVEVSIEEYLSHKTTDHLINNINIETFNINDETIEPDGMTDDWYRYDEDLSNVRVRRTDLRERITIKVENKTQIIQSYQVSGQKTQGYTLSASLTTPEFSAVVAGVSFTWHHSASFSETIVLNVSPNHRGWYEFDPAMNLSYGHVKRFNWLGELKESKFVMAHSPIKLANGTLDGWLIAMEEPLNQ
jgi:hypothetical protein